MILPARPYFLHESPLDLKGLLGVRRDQVRGGHSVGSKRLIAGQALPQANKWSIIRTRISAGTMPEIPHKGRKSLPASANLYVLCGSLKGRFIRQKPKWR